MRGDAASAARIMTSVREPVHRDPVWRERSDSIIGADIEPGDTGKDTEQLWARKIDESHLGVMQG